jgi:hypothetical protein
MGSKEAAACAFISDSFSIIGDTVSFSFESPLMKTP